MPVVLKNGKFAGMTLLKAIRFKCLECQSGSRKAVRNCDSMGCYLFAYRFGHDPARRGIGGGLSNFKKKTSHSSE